MGDTLMHTYARLPVSFVKGEGAKLWDENGKRYARGKGLRVLADGKEIARSEELTAVEGELPW